jgi:hypothetical protein
MAFRAPFATPSLGVGHSGTSLRVPDMTRPKPKRGRPSKFDRPSRVVALTLPEDVIAGLHKVDTDLAWAIVTLVAKQGRFEKGPVASRPDAELVGIAHRQYLIVVNRTVLKWLPGINVIPLNGDRAFLALEPGRDVSDLELAVIDRLEEEASERREHDALKYLRTQLRHWRRDPTLAFEQRAIIVVKRKTSRRVRPQTRS